MPRPRVATGLFTNWDSILSVDERIVDLLRKTPKREPASEVLTTIEEVCYTLDCALRKGGREYLISREVYGELNEMFPKRMWRLGGNGYHMGKALYDRGFNPLVSYPCRPPRMMQASPNFRIAYRGGTNVPSEVAREGDPEYDHVVFEYKENPALGIRGTGRHILSWDEMSSNGLLDVDFLDMATNTDHADVLVLGYAHLLLPARKNVTDLIAQRLDHAQRPRVHLEVGEGSRESVEHAIKLMTKLQRVDSLGLNEREGIQYLDVRSE
ncbi:MAG: ADP-dependent glucokinase/phosphofructokinase, partial [Candidatus Bathyarchaeia archaeon]